MSIQDEWWRTEFLDEFGISFRQAWGEAFIFCPRVIWAPTVFVPAEQTTPGMATWWALNSQRPPWLDLIESGAPVLTQLDGANSRAVHGLFAPVPGTPTSAMPSLRMAAQMLHALDPQPGDRVLEAGTGSGHMTAVLSHRLGDGAVTSIDLDPTLIAAAQARLFGTRPVFVAADATHGHCAAAPYDALISWFASRTLPAAWLAVVEPGGRIVAPLDVPGTAGLVAHLDVIDACTATGWLLPRPRPWPAPIEVGPGWPVWEQFVTDRARPARDPDPLIRQARAEIDAGSASETATRASALVGTGGQGYDNHSVALAVGGYQHRVEVNADGPAAHWFTADDGSWARHSTHPVPDTGGHQSTRIVHQGGPRRLWDLITDASLRWQDHGRPGPGDYRVSVTTDGAATDNSTRIEIRLRDTHHLVGELR